MPNSTEGQQLCDLKDIETYFQSKGFDLVQVLGTIQVQDTLCDVMLGIDPDGFLGPEHVISAISFEGYLIANIFGVYDPDNDRFYATFIEELFAPLTTQIEGSSTIHAIINTLLDKRLISSWQVQAPGSRRDLEIIELLKGVPGVKNQYGQDL